MRVCVDGRSLVGGAGRGVAHYARALLGALAEAHPEDEWVVVVPRGGDAAVPGAAASRLPPRVLYGCAGVASRPRLDRIAGGCDVVWAPAPAPLAVSAGTPLVLSVHDRSWERRPEDFTAYERLWHAVARPRRLGRRAARVLVPTRVGRQDLVAAWGLDPARVRVVGMAPALGSPHTTAEVAEGLRPSPDGPLLFVGALEPRKGPDVLADALRRARARGFARELVVVGAGRCEALLGVEGVRSAGPVDDPALAGLLAAAALLVVPSFDEGFGLPAVEALALGTAILASDLPVHREVLGDGARYVAPGDAEALAEALLELDGDPAARVVLVQRGRAATAGLSWAAAARAAHAALAEAAG